MQMNLKHIKAVAFDLDGTLVDSIADLATSANAMREAMNLAPLPQDRVASYVGDGVGSLVHRTLTDSVDQHADEATWTQGFNLFIRHYHQHLAVHTRMYPGVADALNLLRSLDLPLVVITNKSQFLAVPLLQQLGIDTAFSMILGGDSLDEKKPSALPLLHAAAVLDVKPQEMLLVGDSENDIACARKAGAVAVAVSYGYRDAATLGADLIVGSLVDLYSLIKQARDPHVHRRD